MTPPIRLRQLGMAAGAVSGVSALISLARPEALSRTERASKDDFYVHMFAARALPIAVATVAAAAGERGRGVLALSAAAQVLDAAIGISRRNAPMSIASLVGAAVLGAAAVRASSRPTVTAAGIRRVP